MSRVFTDEELQRMCVPSAEQVIAAIEAGDKDEAKRLAKRMAREFEGIHDTYVSWTSDLMDYIYRNDGESALLDAMKKTVANYTQRRLASKADFRRKAEGLAAGLRGHGAALEIEEDDEKIVIKMKPCRSGQKLLESGAYGKPRNLSRVRAHPMTWGIAEFPIYCVHAPIVEMVAFETNGYLERYCVPAERVAEESCSYVLVKDPKFVPDDIYKRIGATRPPGRE